MKYIILRLSDKTYDANKWLKTEGKILLPLSNIKNINSEDLILLYSIEQKEIKYLLKAQKILENSNYKEIAAKIGKKELSRYDDSNEKMHWTTLFEIKLAKELDKPMHLNEIIPEKEIDGAWVGKFITEKNEASEFKKITGKLKGLNLENSSKESTSSKIKPNEEKENLKEKIQTFIKEKILHENKEEEKPKKVVTHHLKKDNPSLKDHLSSTSNDSSINENKLSMKYIILRLSDKTYDANKWLKTEEKILLPLTNIKNINSEDLILLYSIEQKEIKYLLKAQRILENSSYKEIAAKIGKKELSRYDDSDEKMHWTTLFEIKIAKELDKPIHLNEIIPEKEIDGPWIGKFITEKNEANKFKKITEKLKGLNLENSSKESTSSKEKPKEEKLKKIIVHHFKKDNTSPTSIGYSINENDLIELEKNSKKDTENIREIKRSYFISNGDKCERCGFSFEEKMGKKYIELHCKTSLKSKNYKSLNEVKNDFEFLCANCHIIANNEKNKV